MATIGTSDSCCGREYYILREHLSCSLWHIEWDALGLTESLILLAIYQVIRGYSQMDFRIATQRQEDFIGR